MIRRFIALMLGAAALLVPAGPTHAAGDPVLYVDSLDAAPLGLLTCATDAVTSYCFVALHTADAATTKVTVLRGHFGEPARLVHADLPSAALRTRPDLGKRVVQLTGTVAGIGDVDIITRARASTIRFVNSGCVTYPLQFVLTADTNNDIGIETATSGTVAGQTVWNWTTVCDALVLAPTSGHWALTAP